MADVSYLAVGYSEFRHQVMRENVVTLRLQKQTDRMYLPCSCYHDDSGMYYDSLSGSVTLIGGHAHKERERKQTDTRRREEEEEEFDVRAA